MLDQTDPPERWARLGHGCRVDVGVILFQGEVLQLPLGALFRNGDGRAAFGVEDGRARLIPVEISARNSLSVQVTSGLEAGRSVVLYPSDRVADGIAVAARE